MKKILKLEDKDPVGPGGIR